ncbi:MAG: hypothetical protein QM779_09370 [Propionicimonas sp.]|uniref:hypothetical protein n=1 Tax=Propionicimonas sp. TaxID=1955623 RepID=UPI003D0985AF
MPAEAPPAHDKDHAASVPSGDTVTLFTDGGASVEITGDALAGARSGDRFHGTVAVDRPIADAIADHAAVREVPADEGELGELVADTSATLRRPLRTVQARITAVSHPAATAKAHTVDIFYAHTASQAVPTTAEADAMVSRLGEFWSSQSDGQVTGITRPLAMKSAVVASSRLCDANWLWTYAAGPSGFNRTPAYSGGTADSYYWGSGKAAHLLVLVPGESCGEGFGYGSIGTLAAGGTVWASLAPDPLDWDQTVFHEVGHNLGLGHSNLTACEEPDVDGPSCDQWEYEDFYDVMGGGFEYTIGDAVYTNARNVAALNVTQKVSLNALSRGTGLKEVTAAGGTAQRFTLAPASATTGVRGLEITDPLNKDKLYVEYRSGTGRDASSFYTRISADNPDIIDYQPGVRVLKRTGDSDEPSSTVLQRWVDGSTTLSYQPGNGFLSRSTDTTGAHGVHLTVVSTNASGATVDVAFDAVANDPPVAAQTPVITGSPQVGSTLTAVEGTWTSGTRFTYQWAVAGADVAGATARTFVPRVSDVGSTVTVAVTGSKDGYSSVTLASGPTSAVTPGVLKAGTPTVSGTARIGVTLTAKPGAWDPAASLAYQWLVDGVDVTDATSSTFVPRVGDLGKVVAVRVTGSREGYQAVTKVSAPTSKVRPLLSLSTKKPKILGTPRIGVTLTAKPGSWTRGTTFSYQWLVAGVAVAGATQAKFVPDASALGLRVTVQVTGSKAGYTTTTKASKASSKVRPLLSMKAKTPEISGTAKVGKTLTAKPGSWTSGAKLSYQWMVGGVVIAGATASKYVPVAADVGLTIAVQVTGTKAGYVTTSRTSNPTAAVVA